MNLILALFFVKGATCNFLDGFGLQEMQFIETLFLGVCFTTIRTFERKGE